MPLTDLYVVAVPRHRALYNLPIHASVAAELVLAGPLFQIEQIAEELKGRVLSEHPESQRTAEVSF